MAAVEALVRRHPSATAQMAPGDPRVVFGLAMLEFRQNGGAVSPHTAALVRDAALRAPLAEEPFLFGAVAAFLRKDNGQAEAMLVEARNRSPRARTPHLLLLDRYLRTGRVQQAAAEIAVLSRLLPEASLVLVEQLAQFAKEPVSRRALGRLLVSDPGMRSALLTHMAADSKNADLVMQLAAESAAPRVSPGPEPWQEKLISALVGSGDVRRAYALWRTFAGMKADNGIKAVYDGRFEGLQGLAPFNWSLSSSSAGVAEKGRTPGMQVEYYGRENTVLASQLLILPPGRYRLDFRAEGQAKGEGSRVSWRLECAESKAQIAEIPLTGIGYAPKVVTGAFTVPPNNCSAQWLRLAGVSAEFPSAQSVTITDVQITGARP
jgi:hypothetical protein